MILNGLEGKKAEFKGIDQVSHLDAHGSEKKRFRESTWLIVPGAHGAKKEKKRT